MRYRSAGALFAVFFTPLLVAGCSVHGAGSRGDDPLCWGYHGSTGPEHWGELRPEYEVCSSGTEQSPVDISRPALRDLQPIEFHYEPLIPKIVNNKHTIEVDGGTGSFIVLEGTRYDLLQFHFHAPSEHTLGGRHHAMELHLVHQDPATERRAVIGIMIDPGAANPVLAPIFANLPPCACESKKLKQPMDLAAILPVRREYFRYEGSLTTPPCTEEVKWHILRQPIQMSPGQIAAFTRLIGKSNRPVQELHGRTVEGPRPER